MKKSIIRALALAIVTCVLLTCAAYADTPLSSLANFTSSSYTSTIMDDEVDRAMFTWYLALDGMMCTDIENEYGFSGEEILAAMVNYPHETYLTDMYSDSTYIVTALILLDKLPEPQFLQIAYVPNSPLYVYLTFSAADESTISQWDDETAMQSWLYGVCDHVYQNDSTYMSAFCNELLKILNEQ